MSGEQNNKSLDMNKEIKDQELAISNPEGKASSPIEECAKVGEGASGIEDKASLNNNSRDVDNKSETQKDNSASVSSPPVEHEEEAENFNIDGNSEIEKEDELVEKADSGNNHTENRETGTEVDIINDSNEVPDISKNNDAEENDVSENSTDLNSPRDIMEKIEGEGSNEQVPEEVETSSFSDVVVSDENDIKDELKVEPVEQETVNVALQTPLPPLPPRGPVLSGTQPPLPFRSPTMNVQIPPKRKVPIYAVPPPLSEEMKTETFRKNAAQISNRTIDHYKVMDSIYSAVDINLIANRYRVTSHQLDDETIAKRETIEEGQILLKSNYTNILKKKDEEATTGLIEEKEEPEDREIREASKVNWKFWTSVVNDFALVANKESCKLEQEITKGIPRQIRGIIWQLIANSKSKEFEDIFVTLAETESSNEASIKRDLQRTNFIPKERIDSLFNVLKVYSVYDPDVGYTQGMGFITAPLLLNCESESDAFGLLIVLMKNYGLREFFMPEMPGLMLLLYQFDRVLEENSPVLYNHLTREGIKSSMYATQWFLTFFAYKFPLEFVLRIFDVVFFEGFESILKFAVNLMLKNKDEMVTLKFDLLLNFLKNELFEYYSKESIKMRDNLDSELKRPIIDRSISNNNGVDRNIFHQSDYDVDLFVKDAMNDVHITPISLHRYAEEYKEVHQMQQEKEVEYELLRIKNKQLEKESRKLHHQYALLNKEHISIANELIENRLKAETFVDETNDLKNTIGQLYQQIQEEKNKGEIPNPDASLPVNLKHDLERTMERNTQVMNENINLRQKIKDLEHEIKDLKETNKAHSRNNKSDSASSSSMLSPNMNGQSPNSADVSSTPSTKSPLIGGGWAGFKKFSRKNK